MTQHPVRAFEQLLDELRQTVGTLEDEQLTLEEAVAAYERAVELANACGELLDTAEQRVRTIDASSRSIREQATIYSIDSVAARSLLLGEDEDDLYDLLDTEE
jgi:exodeoxyribonuclease VII small subunit